MILSCAAVLALGIAPAAAMDKMGKDYSYKSHAMKKNIVEIALADEQFSTLVTALKAADLVETIQNGENLTVFAPTNEAFSKLPEGTVEGLLQPENKDQLKAVLTYHVLGSKVMAGDIQEGTTDVETLQGSTASVKKSDGGVMIDNANVIKADVKASNGVIHVIDAVILPQ